MVQLHHLVAQKRLADGVRTTSREIESLKNRFKNRGGRKRESERETHREREREGGGRPTVLVLLLEVKLSEPDAHQEHCC